MADSKITGLAADATPDGADLVTTVDDVAGTATNKKVTLANLGKALDASTIPNTPAGAIAATDVQAAIDELDSEKIGAATSDTLTNKTIDANGTGNSISNIDISDLANGTDGELITWDAAGAPAAVAAGTAAEVLTSNGAGAAPTFQAAGGGGGGPRAFTYVIAASNSRDNTGVDATCDGTADNVEIQAGIDACAAANGGTVMLLDGTYDIDTNIQPKTDVTITGNGNGTVLQRGAAANIFNDNNVQMFRVTIKDMTLDGVTGDTNAVFYSIKSDNEDVTCSNLYIKNVGAAFLVRGIRYTIEGCTIVTSAAGDTIDSLAPGGKIINNRVTIAAGATSGTAILSRADNGIVIGNICIGDDAANGVGINLSNADYLLVDSNIVEGFKNCILAGDQAGSIISNNILKDFINHSILLDDCSNCSIIGNTISENPSSSYPIILIGTNSVGNTIIGNTVDPTTACSYFLQASTAATCFDNIITNNVCTNYATAFALINADNIVKNNVGVGDIARVSTEASSATPTIDVDKVEAHSITALAAAVTSMTTNLSGTPSNFQKLTVRFLDNGTGRAITWGASFEDNGVALPTTTVANKLLTVGFIYDSVSAKWGCVEAYNET